MLISKCHASVISSGNELEDFLASKLKNTNGIAISNINKQNRVFKDAKTDASGKKHNITIDCVIDRDGKIILIELKDGDAFDNKKVEGEVDSLKEARDYIVKNRKLREQDIIFRYCSFNARNHEQVEKGTRGRLPKDFAMTGKELCELLGLDFDKIVQERKKNQEENLNFFISELKKIPEIASKF